MMLRCIIVEDDSEAVESIQQCISKTGFIDLLKTFTCENEGLKYLESNPVDLAFVGINEPGLNGLNFAYHAGPDLKIVFISKCAEHAARSFELNVLDYILKPATPERFAKAIPKLKEFEMVKSIANVEEVFKKNKDAEFHFFKSGTALYKANLDSILYFEKDGNYFKMFTKDRSLLIRLNFPELTGLLPRNQFLRIHKSFIVNIKQVDKIESDKIFIRNTSIPIGENFKSDFFRNIESYIQ